MLNIIDILDELEKNTNEILDKYNELNKLIEEKEKIIKQQEEIINSLNINSGSETNTETEVDNDFGLLGDMLKIDWISGNSGAYSIQNESIIVSGKNKYANISINYKELEENYVDKVRTKYILYIDGYIEKGCSKAYICSADNSLEKNFSKQIVLYGTWQRNLTITIMLNQGIEEDSKLIISNLKLVLG